MDKDLDLKIKVEKFVEDLDKSIFEVDRFVSFLNMDKERAKALKESIKILKKKSKKIKSSKSLKEVSENVRLNKLKKKFGDLE